MGFADKTQFDYLYDALAQRYPGIAKANGESANFQFMQTPMTADWVTGHDARAFELANSTSVTLDGFFVPGGGFANAYRDLVLSLAPVQKIENAVYVDCVAKLRALDAQKQSLADAAHGAFRVFVAENPGTQTTFVQWLADDFGGKSYRDELTELDAQRTDVAKTQTDVVNAIDAPLGLARGAVNPWAQTMQIDEGGALRTVPLVTIGGDLATDISTWSMRPKDQYDFDVTITANDTLKTPWKTTYTTKVRTDCWGTSASLQTNTQRIISDNNYKLRVRARGMNSYKINRGQWYDESLVSPHVKLVEQSAWTPDMFFGENGSLHLIPEEIFVMFQPSIQLTVSTQVYKQQIESNADVDIEYLDMLGMRFEVSGMSSLQPQGDAQTTTITLNPPANQQAQIVGITSKVAWDFDQG
jgi:hypothetical protein